MDHWDEIITYPDKFQEYCVINISIAPGCQDLNYTVSKGNQKTWVA